MTFPFRLTAEVLSGISSGGGETHFAGNMLWRLIEIWWAPEPCDAKSWRRVKVMEIKSPQVISYLPEPCTSIHFLGEDDLIAPCDKYGFPVVWKSHEYREACP